MGTAVFRSETGALIPVFTDVLLQFGEDLLDRLQMEFEVLIRNGYDLEVSAIGACENIFQGLDMEDEFPGCINDF